jgi:hypothetical protein
LSDIAGGICGEPSSTLGCIHCGNTMDTEPDRPQNVSDTKSLLTTRSWPEVTVVVING